jgi:hypothetical protein
MAAARSNNARAVNMTKFHSHILGGAVVLSGLFASELAKAQDAPAAPAPAAPPAAAPPAAAPPAAAPPPAAPPPAAAEPPPVPAPAPVPEPAAAAAPAADNPFKVTVGAGFRSAIRIQNQVTTTSDGNYTKLNDQMIDELNAELRVSGKVTDIIGWTANFTVDGRSRAEHGIGAPIAFQAQALDIIGQLDFMDEFHVWLGRMLTPTDRSNFSGPWFMAPWNYSGVLPTGYFGPRGTEEVGREVGGTVWGDIGKGKFKYYAMVGDLDNNYKSSNGFGGASPLFAARVQFAAIGAEPGFYGSSAYYGGQDILAFGVATQYQKDYECVAGTWNCFPGTPGKDNLFGFNADVLFEKKTGAGTPGIEAAFYYAAGDTKPYKNFFYVLPTFTTGEILPAKGKLNALVRLQMGQTEDPTVGNGKATHMAIEPSVAYLFKDYFAKLQLSYTYAQRKYDDAAYALSVGQPEKQKFQYIQLGFQIQQ